MMRSILSGLTIAFALASAVPVTAQQPGTEAGAAPSNADANNPLAKFQAFNVHNYYVPAISDITEPGLTEGKSRVERTKCIGCGVCVIGCASDAIEIVPVSNR